MITYRSSVDLLSTSRHTDSGTIDRVWRSGGRATTQPVGVDLSPVPDRPI